MFKKMLVLRKVMILPASIILFLTGLFLKDIQLMNIGIILLWLNNVLYGMEKPMKRMFYLAFMGTFFTFILGRTVARLVYDFKNYHIFSDDVLWHTNLCVYIALVSLYYGYIFCEKVRFTKSYGRRINFEDDESRYDSPKYESIRKVAKLLFYSTYVFNILIAVEKAIFTTVSGYAQYYVSYTSRFPYVLVKLGDVCMVAFYIFLATMPSKKEIKIPVILYLIAAIISMFGGKRSSLVVPLITIILYFAVRNKIHRGDKPWLTKRDLLIALLGLPSLLAFLYLFNYSRFGLTAEATSFPQMVAGFFDNLGFSVNIISYEKVYEASIPHKLYSIGDTIDYLRENILTQLFFDFPVYKTQTVEKALNGNNFTQTITYLYSQKYYLSGRGLGSCYIAEAYHDFGYIGIAIWSFIYCYVLKNIYSFKNKGIIYNTMAFAALKYVLEAPRNMASAFLSEYININTWLVIVTVLFAAKIWRQSYYRDNSFQSMNIVQYKK